MILTKTERQIHSLNNQSLQRLCSFTKLLYNYVNYQLRQDFFAHQESLSYSKMVHLLTVNKQVDFKALPPQTAQQVVKLLYKNWKSYHQAIRAYKINPKAFLAEPKIPGYKKQYSIAIVTNQQSRIKSSIKDKNKNEIKGPFITSFTALGLKPFRISGRVKQLQQIRIIPQYSCFVVEIVYREEIQPRKDLDKDLYCAIDLGVNNLATLTTNKSGLKPLLIRGGAIKSINQFYNKNKARLLKMLPKEQKTSAQIEQLTLKRYNLISNFFHHTSKQIIRYCLDNNIGNLAIGHNEEWKQGVNNGKKNNQNFVFIPFNKLIEQLKYKGEEVGVNVFTINESYTSKCDHFALEPMHHHESYLGKRIKRGLFRSSVKVLINADVNGSLGILRKAISDACFHNHYVNKPVNRGLVLNPLMVNPLRISTLKKVNNVKQLKCI